MCRGVGIACAAACCLLPAAGCAVLSEWWAGPLAWSADGKFKGPLESAAPAFQEALRLAEVTAAPEQDAGGLTLAGKTPAGQRVRVRLTPRDKSNGETLVLIEWDEFPDPDLGVNLLKVMEDVAVEAKARESAAEK
jgi:hypothetical protein